MRWDGPKALEVKVSTEAKRCVDIHLHQEAPHFAPLLPSEDYKALAQHVKIRRAQGPGYVPPGLAPGAGAVVPNSSQFCNKPKSVRPVLDQVGTSHLVKALCRAYLQPMDTAKHGNQICNSARSTLPRSTATGQHLSCPSSTLRRSSQRATVEQLPQEREGGPIGSCPAEGSEGVAGEGLCSRQHCAEWLRSRAIPVGEAARPGRGWGSTSLTSICFAGELVAGRQVLADLAVEDFAVACM